MSILKNKTIATVVGLAFALASAQASEKDLLTQYAKSFEKVAAAELPAQAAGAISKVDSKQREATTTAVVKAAVGLNPASAPAIVGAIARLHPEVAALAAKVATQLQPKQAAAIARAAAAAAPEQAGKIVELVCREVPTAYREVATTVAQVAPKSDAQILAGVSAAIPVLRASIAQAQGSGNVGSSVDSVLNTATQPNTSSTPTFGVRGPTIGGALVPITTTPTNAAPGTVVPPGGRDYAHP